MTERGRSASTTGCRSPKMETELLSPRKTVLVLVVVVGCFAVLWPKVFYPMLVGSANQHIKPSPIDKTTGCCDVISETDVNTIKIMSELCSTIIKPPEDQPLSGKEVVQKCRQEVLETCGIDISVVLQEQVRLGQSVKQILDEVRSLNGSLCLKYNFGVAPWRLGVPHRITVKMVSDAPNIRQERPLHLRSELIHPAFRERGRAIPQPQVAPPTRPPPRVVEGRPGPVPGMRPTLGAGGHVVGPSKQSTSSMSLIMPIYTIGIVVFFTYTLMRIIFKKQPEGVGGSLYPPVEPDPHFRKEVFESEASRLGSRLTRESISSKLVVNAMSALLDEVDQEMEARRKSSEVASQDLVNGTLSNGDVVKPQEDEQPTVKVLGMETTASCEGGKKWSRPDSPVLPTPPPAEPVPPPQEIYLEGALPAQSHLLVADSAIESQPASGEDPAVVLAGKMTLSVISLDSENGAEEAADKLTQTPQEPVLVSEAKIEEEIEQALQESANDFKQFEDKAGNEELEYEIEEYVEEPLIVEKYELPPPSKIEVEDLEKTLQESAQSAVVTEEKVENVIQPPLIHLESEDVANTVEVDALEQEVDSLIQEAIGSIENRQPISLEILQNLNLPTNEINDSLQNLENEEKPTLQDIESQIPIVEAVSKEPILTNDDIATLIQEIKSLDQILESNSLEKTEESPIAISTGDDVKSETIEDIPELSSEAPQIEESKQEVTPIEGNIESEQIATPSSIAEKLKTEIAEQVEIAEPRSQIGDISRIETPSKIEKPVEISEPFVPLESSAELTNSTPAEVLPAAEEIQKVKTEISETAETAEPIRQIVEANKMEISTEVEKPVEIFEKVETPTSVAASQENEEQFVPVEISTTSEPLTQDIIQPVEISTKIELSKESEPVQILGVEQTKLEDVQTPESVASLQSIEEKSALVEISTTTEPLKDKLPLQSEEKLQPVEISTTTDLSAQSKPVETEVLEAQNKPVEALQPSEEKSKSEEISEKADIEVPKPSSPIVEASQKADDTEISEIVEKTKVEIVETPKPSSPVEEPQKIEEVKTEEIPKQSSKPDQIEILDDELGSEEEFVEEIEEIVYESNEEESEEESEEAIARNTTDSVPRVNGERSEDLVEESKYTTVSGATAAENDISDEELTDNEEVDDDEEVIEIEEEIEDDDYILDESNDVNHVSGESEPEL